MTILERLGIASPVIQAGMGGGLSRHELAAAVSEAGGLGTVAVNGAAAIERQLAAAKALTGAPVAVNLLLPFARRSWFEAAAGADAVIVQGVEAGGHVRGSTPALELHERVRAALPADYPTLIAGGIADREDVRLALEAGASAAVAGTRFLLSDESRAHPQYKQRSLDATETVLTELFGLGWPAPHRVAHNAATQHWLADDPRGPRLNRALNRLSAPTARFMPASIQSRLAHAQRPGSRLLTPIGPTDDGPAGLVDAGPLYVGETVARIHEVRPAAEIVASLTP